MGKPRQHRVHEPGTGASDLFREVPSSFLVDKQVSGPDILLSVADKRPAHPPLLRGNVNFVQGKVIFKKFLIGKKSELIWRVFD